MLQLRKWFRPDNVITKTRNRTILRLVRQEAKLKEKSPKDLTFDILRYIKSEPLLFAKYINKENVAMYISLFDRIVRPQFARRLWKAMGKPKAFFVPFGHYTSILSFPYAERLAYRFFKEKLAFRSPNLKEEIKEAKLSSSFQLSRKRSEVFRSCEPKPRQ